LYQCKDVKLFSVGENFNNHAPYVFKNYTIVDSVYTSTWIQQLNNVIDLYKIDYIFPAHDDVIIALSKNCSKINAKFITSPIETCLITRSKSRTYDFFHDIVPTPTMYKDLNIITKFPVFVKPDVGQGSQDTHICHNKQELSCVLSNNEDYIVLEYLPGLEYTIDCFSDRECGLLFCKGRLDHETEMGLQ
jgi:carbamoyl-phosphate synthase large subunit